MLVLLCVQVANWADIIGPQRIFAEWMDDQWWYVLLHNLKTSWVSHSLELTTAFILFYSKTKLFVLFFFFFLNHPLCFHPCPSNLSVTHVQIWLFPHLPQYALEALVSFLLLWLVIWNGLALCPFFKFTPETCSQHTSVWHPPWLLHLRPSKLLSRCFL